MKSTRPRAVRPSSPQWTDPQGRRLRYLRLAVTDRCNLRCRYCMPATGVASPSPHTQLGFAELTRICRVMVRGGIRKIRVTGGEPLARRGLVEWMQAIARLDPAPEILLTTNGVLLGDALDGLVAAGLSRINLSLDTLDPITWKTITRRDGFEAARSSIDSVLAAGLGLKINVVVQPGVNDHEIADFVALTRDEEIRVRFIEPMPFTGSGTEELPLVSGEWILDRVRERFAIEELPRVSGDVERRFRIEGHRGTVGVIEGNSRSFCEDCCRLRLNSRGELRTCLYAAPAADLGVALRKGADDEELAALVEDAIARRLPDGRMAEASRHGAVSMAEVGG
jgi:cyclic pyranopterin phosphate synthase